VPRSKSAGNHDCTSDSFGNECRLREPHDSTARRLDGWRHVGSIARLSGGGQRIVILLSHATRLLRIISAMMLIAPALLFAQVEAPSSTRQSITQLSFEMPKSHNPLNAYMPDSVPEPVMANSPRLDQVVRDGKLYLSLKDAIDLALENNLDLAIARYNLPIANTDIVRTKAGGFFRGVNTGVVQGTPGG